MKTRQDQLFECGRDIRVIQMQLLVTLYETVLVLPSGGF